MENNCKIYLFPKSQTLVFIVQTLNFISSCFYAYINQVDLTGARDIQIFAIV